MGSTIANISQATEWLFKNDLSSQISKVDMDVIMSGNMF